MKLIEDQILGGERPLFETHDATLVRVHITDGESAIKECSGIVCRDCVFEGKYPLWHIHGSDISGCQFKPGSRSAIWYSSDMVMRDCVIEAPKFFREMKNLSVEEVAIRDADETFWSIDGLTVRDVCLRQGRYPFMHCRNVTVEGLECDALYVFQYCKDVEIHNARIVTKDAFWEVENVTIYDSVLEGEYLGWHSKNLRLVNCHIAGEQPLCYCEGLVLENCTFDSECDRAFEYSSVQADILGSLKSIKNPSSGCITLDSVGEIIIDENIKAPANCKIIVR